MIYQEDMKNILLLGGSSEGFELAEKLHLHPEIHVISSMAGRTSLPRKPKGELRVGGFGGTEGLVDYIKTNNIAAIIDATHPFAEKISRNVQQAASKTACPCLMICRPPWQKQQGDQWHEVKNVQEAADILTTENAPVFLTIGRLELAAFLSRPDLSFIARAIEPPKPSDSKGPPVCNWPDNLQFIYGKGPFTVKGERELMETYGIRSVVTKNSGSPAAYAKIEVARTLELPVIMIKRPPVPEGPVVKNTKDALTWLEAKVFTGPDLT